MKQSTYAVAPVSSRPARMTKYRNVKTNGFDSKKEAARAAELELWQKIGVIADLRYQVRLELIPACKHERSVSWVADFVYIDLRTNLEVWEDVKGKRTRDYIIKRKLALFLKGIKIHEV